MELFLNLLWLLIALTALVVWRCEWKRHECGAPPKAWQQWTAFACTLVFLFFAVSLSDDLRAATILADDCALGRHHSLTWNCGCAEHGDGQAIHESTLTLPVASFFELNPLAPSARVALAVSAVAHDVNRIETAFRGPPAASL
jgi:hypothetical protein